ncbi:putative cytochrome P450 301a1, mitochondrial [Ixodes scapularis]
MVYRRERLQARAPCSGAHLGGTSSRALKTAANAMSSRFQPSLRYNIRQGQEWYNLRSKTQPYTLRLRTIMSYVPGLDKIAEDTLKVLAHNIDARGETPDCYALLYRWAQESVMFASLDTRIGFLSVPLDPLSDGAMILRDMNDAFACLQIFGYRFPYFRYLRTPTWKRFERAMDDFSV